MKPPICYFCQRVYDEKAELVQFADFRPLEENQSGHPHGVEWFCSKHQAAAKSLAHLPIDEAMKKMRWRIFRWWG